MALELKRGMRFKDVYGTWSVIQVHPPVGRRGTLYTILNEETSKAEMVSAVDLQQTDNQTKILGE